MLRRGLPPFRRLTQASSAARVRSVPAAPAPLPPLRPAHRQSAHWQKPPITAAAPSPPRSDRSSRLLLSYHDLERALARRGLDTARVLLGGALAALAAFGLAWPRIKQWGAVEGAEVAAASLQQEAVQDRAAAVVADVLGDARTVVQVESVLKEAALALLCDEGFEARAVDWTAKVLRAAAARDDVTDHGTRYIQGVLAGEHARLAAEAFLSTAVATVAADPAVQDVVSQGLWSGVRASIVGRRGTAREGTKAAAGAGVGGADDAGAQNTKGLKGEAEVKGRTGGASNTVGGG